MANPYDYSTTVVTVTTPPSTLPYYPVDSPAYNDLKRSIYILNQALGSVCFNAQSYYDYYNFNKYSPTYQADYNQALSKLANSENYLTNSYNDYLRALNAYKAALNSPIATTVLTDNIGINPAILV